VDRTSRRCAIRESKETMNTNQDTKRRREFQLEDKQGNKLATGVLYNEGNVQVLWRVDQGYTAEQYASINLILELMPGITTFRFIGET